MYCFGSEVDLESHHLAAYVQIRNSDNFKCKHMVYSFTTMNSAVWDRHKNLKFDFYITCMTFHYIKVTEVEM